MALVISRKVGEQILIGNGIEVTVLKISGARVQLGIKTPDGMKILRKEIVLDSNETRGARPTVDRGENASD